MKFLEHFLAVLLALSLVGCTAPDSGLPALQPGNTLPGIRSVLQAAPDPQTLPPGEVSFFMAVDEWKLLLDLPEVNRAKWLVKSARDFFQSAWCETAAGELNGIAGGFYES